MSLVKEIEAIERLHRDGTLSQSEFTAAKAAILNEVPDAEESRPSILDSPKTEMILRGLWAPFLTIAILWLSGLPVTLALTAGATLLAAIVVAGFHASEAPSRAPETPPSKSRAA